MLEVGIDFACFYNFSIGFSECVVFFVFHGICLMDKRVWLGLVLWCLTANNRVCQFTRNRI